MNLYFRTFDLIEERGITAYQMAKDLGFTTSKVTSWKNGSVKPSIDALVKIADYFDVSLDYLVGRTDNPVMNK